MSRWLLFLLFCLFTPLASAADSAPWPPGFEELEAMALKEPGPGNAFGNVCQIAATTGRLEELRERWKRRDDAPALILLGWLDHETRGDAEPGPYFQQAAEKDPISFAARWSLAWSAAARGLPEAEEAEREALAAAKADEDRFAALRLTANRLCAKGTPESVATARRFLKDAFLKAETPGLRQMLIPDVAHAALADGTAEEWLAGLELAHAGGKNWAASAEYAAACAAFHEPALALQAANEGLARHAGERALLQIAAQAAFDAGFITEAAGHTLALLGEKPGTDEVCAAMEKLTEAGAAHGIRELIQKHAGALAAGATRWRSSLPALRKLGLLPALRTALAPMVQDGDWEGHLVLAEMAVMEHERGAAATYFWRLLEPAAEKRPIATHTQATATQRFSTFQALPLSGIQFRQRLKEARGLYQQSSIFDRYADRLSWTVPTLADARDYAVASLHRMAIEAGGAEEQACLARLREATAAWPPVERVLVAAIAGSPAMMLEELEKFAAAPAEAGDAMPGIARWMQADIVALPWLEGPLAQRAKALSLPAPVQKKGATTLISRWRTALYEPFKHFMAGELEMAEAAFFKAVPMVRIYYVDSIESFYNSLASALDSVPAEKQVAAAHKILEWMAAETATRLDTPDAPDASILYRKQESPLLWMRMFVPPGNEGMQFYSPDTQFHRFPGGWVAPQQSDVLWFWRVQMRDARHLEHTMPETRLAGPGLRLLRSYYALLAAWNRDQTGATPLFQELKKDGGETTAGILEHYLANLETTAVPDPGVRAQEKESAKALNPKGAIGRAALLTGKALTAGGLPPAEELGILRPGADEQTRLLLRYTAAVPADAARLARAWPLREHARMEVPDAPLALQKLMALAEVDRAVALAREILSQQPGPLGTERNDDFTPPGTPPAPRLAALRVLRELGELQSWIQELQRIATANPKDVNARLAIVEATDFVITEKPAQGRSKKAGLEQRLSADARKAATEALQWLAEHSWGNFHAWRRWANETQSAKDEALQEALAERLNSARVTEYTHYELRELLDFLPPEKAAAVMRNLAQPERNFSPSYFQSVHDAAYLAEKLWKAGNRREAVQWLRRSIRTASHGAGYSPSLHPLLFARAAALGDREELAQCIAEAIGAQTQQPTVGLAFPIRGDEEYSPASRAVLPLFEAAQRHGVAERVRELVAAQKQFGPALALLSRVSAGDREAAAEFQARFDDTAAAPLPNALLEDFAAALASQPEERALAARILMGMDSYRQVLDPAQALPRMARHARIGTTAGAADAEKWMLSVSANLPLLNSSDQLAVLRDTLDAGVRNPKEGIIRHVSLLHSKLYATHGFSIEPLVERIDAAIDQHDGRLLGALLHALRGARELKDNPELLRTLPAAYERYFKAQAGMVDAGMPVAWLSTPGAGAGQEDTLAWDLGWLAGLESERTTLGIANATAEEAGKCSVELFWGRQAGRLELLKRIDATNPSGRLALKLPEGDVWMAVSIRTPTKTVLGAPRLITRKMKPIPLAEKLAQPLWQQRDGGPGGKRFSLASYAQEWMREDPGTLLGKYPVNEMLNVHFACWMKHGAIKFVGRDAAGQQTSEQALQYHNRPGWVLHEAVLGLNVTAPGHLSLPAGTVEISAYVVGNAEISGAWHAVLPAPGQPK